MPSTLATDRYAGAPVIADVGRLTSRNLFCSAIRPVAVFCGFLGIIESRGESGKVLLPPPVGPSVRQRKGRKAEKDQSCEYARMRSGKVACHKHGTVAHL